MWSRRSNWRRGERIRCLPATYVRRGITARLLKTLVSTTSGFVLAGVVCTAALGATLGAIYYAAPKVWKYAVQAEEGRDACSMAPTRVDVILVDSSDPLVSLAQGVERDELVRKFLEDSEEGRRIAIARLTGDPMSPLEVLYRGCDPGAPHEKSILFNTPVDVAERRQREYIDKIKGAIKNAYVPPVMPMTPLIEGLNQLFNQQEFYGVDSKVAKRLLIITDTLQNSAKVTAYPLKKPGSKKPHTSLPTRIIAGESNYYIDSLRTTVTNTTITVGFLYRPNLQHLQTRRYEDWFRAYLASNGAQVAWVHLW